jgi:hypothetical protein
MGFYTYLWLRKNGTPYYVGKGKGKRAFVKNDHRFNPPPNAEYILIQEFPDEAAAFAAEKLLISFYGRQDLGTGCLRNLTDGGENPPSWLGRKHSEESLKKMCVAQKGNRGALGFVRSAENRKKISVWRTGRPRPDLVGHTFNVGRKLTPEHKAKIAAAHLGKKRSAETRQIMRLAQQAAARKRKEAA